MLSSDCSQIGTGSSNSPRSAIQSVSFGTHRRIAGKAYLAHLLRHPFDISDLKGAKIQLDKLSQ
jgi:hypothetical protein